MMDKFKKLMVDKAKSGKVLSAKAADQKLSVLDELDDMLGQEIGKKVKGLKKVTVASSSDEGLKEGLDKAEEMLDEKMDEKSEEPKEEESEEEPAKEMSDEQIKAEIARLQAMLQE